MRNGEKSEDMSKRSKLLVEKAKKMWEMDEKDEYMETLLESERESAQNIISGGTCDVTEVREVQMDIIENEDVQLQQDNESFLSDVESLEEPFGSDDSIIDKDYYPDTSSISDSEEVDSNSEALVDELPTYCNTEQ